jgi:hypothetical protein
VSRQEVARAHWPLACRLDLLELNDAAAGADTKSIAGGFDNRAGRHVRLGADDRRRSQEDQALTVEERERVRPGMKTPNEVVNPLG